jgi:hypothetical protein
MTRATFRQRPPTRGIRAPVSDRCRRPDLLQPQRLGPDVSTIAAEKADAEFFRDWKHSVAVMTLIHLPLSIPTSLS